MINSRTQSRSNTGTRQHPREILAVLCSQHSGSQHSSTHRHRYTGLSTRPLYTQAKASLHTAKASRRTGKGLSAHRQRPLGTQAKASRHTGKDLSAHRQRPLYTHRGTDLRRQELAPDGVRHGRRGRQRHHWLLGGC